MERLKEKSYNNDMGKLNIVSGNILDYLDNKDLIVNSANKYMICGSGVCGAIYKKANKKAWAAFVPIYRNITMLKICKMSPWWLLLLLVPIIGWIILWIVSVASKFMLAEAFGKGTGFAFGLWLLAPIFETILVFSRKTKYIGFEEENEE